MLTLLDAYSDYDYRIDLEKKLKKFIYDPYDDDATENKISIFTHSIDDIHEDHKTIGKMIRIICRPDRNEFIDEIK